MKELFPENVNEDEMDRNEDVTDDVTIPVSSTVEEEEGPSFSDILTSTPARRMASIQCSIKPAQSSQQCQATPRTMDVGVQCLLLVGEDDDDDDDDDDDYMDADDFRNDPTWIVGGEEDSFTDDLSNEDDDWNDVIHAENTCPLMQEQYLCFFSCIQTLFQICTICLASCEIVKKRVLGSCLCVETRCKGPEKHQKTWFSQPMHGRMPLGNLSMAAAIYLSDIWPARFLMCANFNICMIKQRAYSVMQTAYLIPAISKLWKSKQQSMFNELKSKNLTLGGDARCCSPGHTAKFGSYSLMDLETNVLDVQLVQSSEVTNSNAMELEGLKRSIEFLKTNGMKISSLVTDRHIQIRKYIRKDLPDIKHWFDVWHVSKGIYKKIVNLSIKKNCSVAGEHPPSE
ncbi:uncharacterized protein LOC141907572 isoform X2 [Tubulanus polymorphus]|uniref:uncharacterized protein LOC141907572 isoform X2 n=1 Tax=Tubulanus polymorphus TaxID=672921 RepID=UPI003DA67933